MRTKAIVNGFKNSQKIRVILDGVGIYMTVKDTDHIFATIKHREVVMCALHMMAKDKITGYVDRFIHYDDNMNKVDVDVQVDLL
jgi:hypothetical protein